MIFLPLIRSISYALPVDVERDPHQQNSTADTRHGPERTTVARLYDPRICVE